MKPIKVRGEGVGLKCRTAAAAECGCVGSMENQYQASASWVPARPFCPGSFTTLQMLWPPPTSEAVPVAVGLSLATCLLVANPPKHIPLLWLGRGKGLSWGHCIHLFPIRLMGLVLQDRVNEQCDRARQQEAMTRVMEIVDPPMGTN